MEPDEMSEQLGELVRSPLRLVADEIRAMVAIYRESQDAAFVAGREATTVPKMHAAELQAARAKGAADALEGVARVLDAATKKGR